MKTITATIKKDVYVHCATEHEEQVAFIRWCRLSESKYPELKLIFAIPNGQVRDVRVARSLKQEGQKNGVSDLFLPVARGPYHGLFLEMKRTNKGAVSKEQKEFIESVSKQGYLALICRGWIVAKEVIEEYLNG